MSRTILGTTSQCWRCLVPHEVVQYVHQCPLSVSLPALLPLIPAIQWFGSLRQ